MPISEEIEQLILAKATDAEIREVAIKEGMSTLRMAAIEKMKQGVISLEEVMSVT